MVFNITEIEYFFIVLELHTVEYPPIFFSSYSQVLFYLFVTRRGTLSSFLFFFYFLFFLSPIGTHSCKSNKLVKSKKMASIYGQRKEEWIWFACQVLFLAIFFDNSWRTFNTSSCISSRMKLLEYHASSWHGHASHLMVFWLMSSH